MNASEAERLDLQGFGWLGSFDREGADGDVVHAVALFDFDSYRSLSLARPASHVEPVELHLMTPDEMQAYYEKRDREDPDSDFESIAATCRLLRPLMDDLPLDVMALDMDQSGRLLWTSTDVDHNPSWSTYYPSVAEYRLQRPVATVLRSQLAVVEYLAGGTDKVLLALPGRNARRNEDGGPVWAFKHAPESSVWGGHWSEIQIMAQFPPNRPHLLHLDRLVVEEISGLGVVGFTAPFIPSPSLDRLDPPRPLKLRWLRELMAVVDELNLEFGILHQDIAARNLFINPATDAVLLFDFSMATGIGYTGPNPYRRPEAARNDVKGVVILAYHLVTRDPRYAFYYLDRVDETDVEDRAKWVSPAGVKLDHDASVSYDEVMVWAAKRRAGPHISHYTEAPRHFDLPEAPDPPEDIIVSAEGVDDHLISVHGSLSSRVRAGRPVLSWQRPPGAKVDKSRRPLATGRYADEEKDMSGIAVPYSKRGFPQPPVENNSNGAAVKVGHGSTVKKRKRRHTPIDSETGE
ncbi:hypothetical protein C8A03DRAFT_36928 [Achaetomium macrosporum]|uniref:non-specific serine/threonine protein kinase n=1 Tax=Achaetomium macrosporum TaxID=79813 RepID=A0AAN7C4R8_9PEZI|nr:hypothetical protein C8A03DRAFT_36928 [Achaetomium macrosporum]